MDDATPSREAVLRELLAQEKLVAEIQEIRSPSVRKRWWESAAVVTSLTALGTVLITAIAGHMTQMSAKEREQVIAEQAQQLQLQRESLAKISTILAEMQRANGDRLDFAYGRYDGLSQEQRVALIQFTNEVDQRWRIERANGEFLVKLHFGADSTNTTAWTAAHGALHRYTLCAAEAYNRYVSSVSPVDTLTCAESRGNAEQALDDLRNRLIAKHLADVASIAPGTLRRAR